MLLCIDTSDLISSQLRQYIYIRFHHCCTKLIGGLSLASNSGHYRILPLEMKLLVLLSAVPVVAMASVKGGAATWGFLKAHEGTCCTCELLLQEITKVQTAQMGK